MRTFPKLLAVTIAVFLVSGAVLPGQTVETGRLMREKLRYSQDLLEGLMTSNFEQLSKASAALAETTKMPAWAYLDTPEYDRYSTSFLRATRKLQDAAQQRDSDAAFLAYMGVNMSCYQCHRYMKGERIAR